jgi:membrane-bound ClpP family serine protease
MLALAAHAATASTHQPGVAAIFFVLAFVCLAFGLLAMSDGRVGGCLFFLVCIACCLLTAIGYAWGIHVTLFGHRF